MTNIYIQSSIREMERRDGIVGLVVERPARKPEKTGWEAVFRRGQCGQPEKMWITAQKPRKTE